MSAIKCVGARLRFRRFSHEGGADLAPAWHQRVVSSSRLFGVTHKTQQDQLVSASASKCAHLGGQIDQIDQIDNVLDHLLIVPTHLPL